jgi:hypothetical protein
LWSRAREIRGRLVGKWQLQTRGCCASGSELGCLGKILSRLTPTVARDGYSLGRRQSPTSVSLSDHVRDHVTSTPSAPTVWLRNSRLVFPLSPAVEYTTQIPSTRALPSQMVSPPRLMFKASKTKLALVPALRSSQSESVPLCRVAQCVWHALQLGNDRWPNESGTGVLLIAVPLMPRQPEYVLFSPANWVVGLRMSSPLDRLLRLLMSRKTGHIEAPLALHSR